MINIFFSSSALSLPLLCFGWCIFRNYILQGSVATRFGCGEIFNVSCIANFPQSVPVGLQNRLIFGDGIWTKVWWYVFYGSQCSRRILEFGVLTLNCGSLLLYRCFHHFGGKNIWHNFVSWVSRTSRNWQLNMTSFHVIINWNVSVLIQFIRSESG